jgi:hypothetical protein
MKWVWFFLKLPIFLLLAPIVWLFSRSQRFTTGRPPQHTWIAFVNWLRGAPAGYRYPREEGDEIDLRSYER